MELKFEKVDIVPELYRGARTSVFAPLIADFRKSGVEVAILKGYEGEKTAKQIVSALQPYLNKHSVGVKATLRNGSIYLIKTDDSTPEDL